ncbi:S41 family peptidase [Capnocytophaga catalasegens]|uniref:S41 family peptidase n=1 Tax=Capnocytophaga catalasegens TaxID=1004260 RepID=UPI00222F930D|nr:S41 family peptidase [Capnocytophaga catalasegens]
MKKIYYFFSILTLLGSCTNDIDDAITPYSTLAGNNSVDYQIKDFIWKGLNTYYLWQEDVPDLADNRFGSLLKTNVGNEQYVKYLNEFHTPELLFYMLRHQDDPFSFIISDYRKLENLLQGVSLTTGMDMGFTTYNEGKNWLGYVKYVLPNSDASKQGVKRGDVFIGVDGQILTRDNYQRLLFSDKPSLIFEFAQLNPDNTLSPGKTLTIAQSQLQKNPIYLHKIHQVGNKKIGYLMYNSFVGGQYDLELNNIFAGFKSEGITDMVLDLRYNSGGSVQSAIYLASMLLGGHTNDIFVKQRSNKKLEPIFKDYKANFVDKISQENQNGSITNIPIHSLNLPKIYIITSTQTASASELIINGLRPFIDVVLIGEVTQGKNTASTTIKDFIDKNKTLNPNHNYAMQPIILISENANGFGDYRNGFAPNYLLKEEIENLGVLGEESDPLFCKAIDLITGRLTTSKMQKKAKQTYIITDQLQNHSPEANMMYIDNKFLEK